MTPNPGAVRCILQSPLHAYIPTTNQYTAPMLKASVPVANVVPLAKLGQGLTYKAEYKDRVRFEKAGKAVEKAAKAEATNAGIAF